MSSGSCHTFSNLDQLGAYDVPLTLLVLLLLLILLLRLAGGRGRGRSSGGKNWVLSFRPRQTIVTSALDKQVPEFTFDKHMLRQIILASSKAKIASGKSHKFYSTTGLFSQFSCRFYVLCLTHLGPVCPHRVAPHQSPQHVLLLHKVSSGGFRPTLPSKNSSLSKLAMTRWVMTESYQSCHADSFHGSGLAGKEASLQAFPASAGGPRQILTDPIKAAQKTCKANLEVFFAMTFVPSQVFLFKYRHSSRLLITLIAQDTKKKSAVKVLS